MERIGLELGVLAELLEVTTDDLARWVVGTLGVEQSDMIEVGLAMLEMRRPGTSLSRNAPTLPILAISAA